MTTEKWKKPKGRKNIEYKLHPKRKKDGSSILKNDQGYQKDRFFRGHFMAAGKRYVISFGWESDGWSPVKCENKVIEYKNNAKHGQKPTSWTEEQEINRQREKEKEKQKQIEQTENITFSDFWYQYYQPYQEEKPNWKAEKSFFKNWINESIGNQSMKDITIFDLEKLYTKIINEGRTEKTAQHILATIRQTYNRAITTDIFPGPNPVTKIKMKKINNQRVRFLSQDESNQLLNQLLKKSTQVHDIALISLHTGMRKGEILKLKWNHINFNSGIISVVDTKNYETRHVYMTDNVSEVLENRYSGQKNGLVFTTENGNQIVYLSKTFKRAVDWVGLNHGIEDTREKVVFHTLRHTFASWQVQAGMDLYTLQNLLGHKSFQMVQRYAHLAPGNLEKATNIFNRRSGAKIIEMEKYA